MKTQYAVFEKVPAHGSKPNGVILCSYNTKEEAQSAGEKYGYNTDNYYVGEYNWKLDMTTEHIHNWNDTCDVRYTCPLQRKQECVCGATRYVEIPDSGIPVVKLSDEELKQYLMKKWSSILDKNVSDTPMSVLIESQQKELISDTESRDGKI